MRRTDWKRRSLAGLAVLLVGVLGGVSSGWAGPDEGNDVEASGESESEQSDRIIKAQSAFDRGAQFYEAGEYAKAVVEFRKAHSILAHPLFLHNIALARAKLGRYREALETAQKVVGDERMDPKTATSNRALIEACRVRVTAPRVAEAKAELLAGMEQERGFGPIGWTGVGVATAGAGSLIASALLYPAAKQNLATLRDDSFASQSDLEAFRTKYSRQQSLNKAFLFGGVALTTVGAGLVTWEIIRMQGAESAAQSTADAGKPVFRPSVGPRNVSLSVSW